MIIIKLTDIELEIMDLLWKNETPLTASEIISASPNRTWKETSIHVILKTLQAKNAVLLDGYVPTAGRSAGVYKAALTVEEYAVTQVRGYGVNLGNFIKAIVEDEVYSDMLSESGWVIETTDITER